MTYFSVIDKDIGIKRKFFYYRKGKENRMGVVIGRMDSQVEKIFLGDNLTRSTKNYDKMLEDENLPEEERKRILAARKKKEEDEIIL